MTHDETTFAVVRNAAASGASHIVISCWLVFLFLGFFWLVVGTLSAHGFQDRIEDRNVGKQEADEISLVTIDAYVTLTKEIALLRGQLSEIEEEIQFRTQVQTETQARVDKARDRAIDIAKEIGPELDPEFLPGSLAISRSSPDLFMQKIDNFDAMNKQRVQPLKDNRLDALRTAHKYWDESARELTDVQATLRLLQPRMDQLKTSLKEKQGQHETFKGHTGVETIASEYEFFDRMHLLWLASMPNHFLVLLLTMAMGGLGSLIYITREYFRVNLPTGQQPDDRHPLSWYIFRPFLGVAIALAVYILARAGQLTVADGDLSPYFVAFLGIISGLLSEQAAERIRAAGSAVFLARAREGGEPGPDDEPRWGIKLDQAITDSGRDPLQLARQLGEKPEQVASWLDGKEPLPVNAQRIISAWLNLPLRELFTDLPPLGADPEGGSEGETATENAPEGEASSA